MTGRHRRHRRRSGVWRRGAFVVGFLAGMGLLGCSTGREASVAPPPTAPAPPTTARPTASELVDAVQVVDSGLTEGSVIGCNTPGGQADNLYPSGYYPDGCPPELREPTHDSVLYGSVSYGFVVENTSDQVMTQVPVTYRFLNSAGQVIVERDRYVTGDDPTGDTYTIPVLRPGERVGFGGMRYPGRPGAVEIQIEVGEPSNWMPEAAWYVLDGYGRADHGELTITELDVHPGDSNEPVTSFTVESSYEEDKRRPEDTFVVFYDAGGRIVGGARDDFHSDTFPAGGPLSGEIELEDPIAVPGIDASRTEIYFPGLEVAPR
jgi:hypothetical protein